jgi:transposase-like protein
MMAERGLSMAHTMIMRWAQRYAPEFEKRWRRCARVVGRSWRVDKTHVKIRGKWYYLYRAVDRAGRTVDFRLSATRKVAAAKAFFRKAIKSQQRCPQTITLDGYAASHRAVRELKADGSLPADAKLCSSKYLNTLIEQDHRGVKQRIAVMLGFKRFTNAAITIAGIELLHRIRKWQFRLGRLGVQGEAAPRSGTRCFGPEVGTPRQSVSALAVYLHQSHLEDRPDPGRQAVFSTDRSVRNQRVGRGSGQADGRYRDVDSPLMLAVCVKDPRITTKERVRISCGVMA